MSRKILVTGAGGFIGYHLSEYLANQGHHVIGLDLHYSNKTSSKFLNRFRPVVSDFRNWDLIKELMKDVQVIFHLASAHLQISLPESEYWDINVHSLRPLLRLAQQSGVERFVHVSSVGVYGDLLTHPANEETLCSPQSIYGETKLAGETEVLDFSSEKGFPVVILRPAWVYGPGCPRTRNIARALRKRLFIMIGKGRNLRHPIYISDMLNALHLSMERDEALGEILIIAGDRAITTNELVKSFCDVLEIPTPKIRIPYWLGLTIAYISQSVFKLAGKEPPFSRRTLEFFDTNNDFDISKARKTLGFEPRTTFINGLFETARSARV